MVLDTGAWQNANGKTSPSNIAGEPAYYPDEMSCQYALVVSGFFPPMTLTPLGDWLVNAAKSSALHKTLCRKDEEKEGRAKGERGWRVPWDSTRPVALWIPMRYTQPPATRRISEDNPDGVCRDGKTMNRTDVRSHGTPFAWTDWMCRTNSKKI